MKTTSNIKIQEEIYKSIERHAPAVLCQFSWNDHQPSFLYAEGKLKSNLGFDPDCEAPTFWEGLDTNDRAILKGNIGESEKTLSPFTWDGKYVASNTRRWLRAYFEPKKTNNKIVWSGAITDISGLKRNEDMYQEMRDLLGETEKMAKIGSWKIDVKTMVPVWSNEVYKIYGLKPHRASVLKLGLDGYPGDARRVLEEALSLAFEQGVGYDLELPFVAADDTKKWVRTIGKAKFENGKVSKLYGVIQDISSQKEAEERSRLMDAMLSEAEALSHSGSWEANLVTGQSLWSAGAFRIFGYTPEKDKGLSNDDYEKLIHPDDFENYKDVLARAIKEGKPCNFDFRVVMPSGEIKHVQSIGKPVRNEHGRTIKLFGALQDITHRKSIEEALLSKKAQLSTFITSSPVAISMLDKHLNYIAASDVWIQEYMQEGIELTGKNHLEMFPEMDDNWVKALKRCLEGEVTSGEEDKYVRPNGSVEWLKWEVRPWFEKDSVVGGIILYSEVVTQSKLAREELVKTKEKAEEAAMVKSQFLATMSHEIRTPMNAVIGLTKLLIENNPREDQLKNLNTLQFSAKNLLQIINDILDLNKIEAGKIEFECIKFNLYGLVSNIKDTFEPQAQSKDIGLRLIVNDNVPEFVWGDPVRLGQVITNLLNNALKFTLEGAVTISISLKKRVDEAVEINFAVEDTGIGIANDKLSYIFESFTQASSETTRKFGGTGLGLSITRKLLEMQGSALNVRSRVGIGSVFEFDLKFKNMSSLNTDTSTLIAAVAKKSLKGTTVLLAEDNKINVMVAQQFLKKWDIDLDVAEDGEKALEMAKINDYDLILMDLLMPVMDGYMATKAIRNLKGKKYKNIPIIALTASAMTEIKEKALEAGMVDYISKPFDPDILYEKILFYTQEKNVAPIVVK